MSGAVPASFPGRDATLRWDGAGSLHVLYVEDGEDGANGARVAYRRLGAAPGGPMAVTPDGVVTTAHGETPPALERLADGTLVAAYPVPLPGKWKNELRLQRSADGGATWSAPELIHEPRAGSHSYLSSAVAADGRLALAWLDDSSGRMGVRAAWSADGRAFSAPASPDPAACHCCGTALLAGRGGEVWLAYRDEEEGEVRDVRLLAAPAGGTAFAAGPLLSPDGWAVAGCPHTGARLAQGPDGALWATWFTGTDPGAYVATSLDGGQSFGPRELVAGPGGDVLAVKHPEVGVLPDGRVAVLWEAAEAAGGRPVMARLRDPVSGAWGEPLIVVAAACSLGAAYAEAPADSGSDGVRTRAISGGRMATNAHDLGGNQTLTVNAVIAALTPDCKPGPACRSVRPSVSFDQVQFEYASDRLTTDARQALDIIAAALKSSALHDDVFTVEGHTDAKGSLPYNMKLSKRRAESVKRYLIEDHKIAAQRVSTVGKGPTDLKDKLSPNSGVNRRVVFVREATNR